MQKAKPDDLRVADYVLGLMDERETEQFERDMRLRPEIAGLVDAWRERVAEADKTVLLTPHEQLRRRIERGLMNQAARGQTQRRRLMTSEFRDRMTNTAIGFGVGVAVGASLVWFVLN